MKKLILIACACLLLSGCFQDGTSPENNCPPGGSTSTIANPFCDYDTIEEAFVGSGLKMNLPASVAEYNMSIYRAMPNKLLEVIYLSGENMMKIRKSLGEEDNSGTYNADTYEKSIIEHNGLELHVQTQDGLVRVIHWSQDGESFSMTSDTGIKLDDVLQLVDTINV